jgi:hypothetical protein
VDRLAKSRVEKRQTRRGIYYQWFNYSLSCRKSHLSCEELRPCKRCLKKGIDCVEQPIQPKCTSCPVRVNPLTTNLGMGFYSNVKTEL